MHEIFVSEVFFFRAEQICLLKTPSWMSLENARYMMKYAAAVYGWELYMAYNCGCGDWWKALKRMSCCACCCRYSTALN